jgi:hypothetical protein
MSEAIHVAQICRTDADVARALEAWAGYRRGGRPPKDVFKSTLPRKHTLKELWTRDVSKAARQQILQESSRPGGAYKVNMEWTAPQSSVLNVVAQPKVQLPAEAMPDQVAAAPTEAASPTVEAAGQRSQSSENAGASSEAAPVEGSSENPQVPGRTLHVPDSAGTQKDMATQNAFSVLLSSARSAALPKGGNQKAGQHAQPRSMSIWRDVLHQVAMHPERYAIAC